MENLRLASVKFKSAGKVYYFSTDLELEKGEYVVKIESRDVASKVFAKIKNNNITKYDVEEPSLNEIFIEKVGSIHE